MDPSGGICAVGYFGSPDHLTSLQSHVSQGGLDGFVIKFSSSGEQGWLRTIGTALDDSARAVSLDEMGNVYVAGYTNGSLNGECSSGSSDIFVTKYSPLGVRHWTRQIDAQSRQVKMGMAALQSLKRLNG